MLRDQLDYMTQYLLRKAPRKWKPLDYEALSAVEQCALAALVDAGLIELRVHRQFRMTGVAGVVDAILTFTGEFGLIEATKQLAAAAYADNPHWKSAAAPLQWADVEQQQWRLTGEGATARDDQDNDRGGLEVDFSLRLGRYANREPFPGFGSATPVTASAMAAPVDARVVNWSDGKDIIAEALRQALVGTPYEPSPLVVDIETCVATLNGKRHQLKTERHARWLKVVAERRGAWTGPIDLEDADEELIGVRSERVANQLPPEIRKALDCNPGSGFRLRMA